MLNTKQDGTLKVEFNQWNQSKDDGTLIYEDQSGRNQEGNINNYEVEIWRDDNDELVHEQKIDFNKSKQLYSEPGTK